MTSYTPSGPYNDGTAPGLDASLFNNIESFLSTINALAVNTAITPTVKAGTSGGSVTMWALGTTTGSSANCFKMYLFYFNAYQNSTGTRQQFILPTPFTTGGIAWCGGIHVPVSDPTTHTPRGIYTVSNIDGGHNWNVFVGYNPSGTPYNSAISQAVLPCYCIGEFNSVMYRMDVDGSTSAPANGWVMLMGI